MVALHRAGRSFDELAKEFGPTSWSIRQWVKRAERDEGRGDGGLTTAERDAPAAQEPSVEGRTRDSFKCMVCPLIARSFLCDSGKRVCVNVSGLLAEPIAPGLDGTRAHRAS